MTDNPLIGIAAIFVLGIGAQWVAWRLRLPGILLLLLAGMAAGPGTALLAQHHLLAGQFLDPQRLFGPLLLPLVSLSVALILFEGGLTLALNQIAGVGHVVGKLVTIGSAVSWACATLAAYYILGLPRPVAILVGAILVVTGPTVIGPLLRQVRPVGQVGPVLRWEGIVIDPLGVLLTVLVFQVISAGSAAAFPAFVLREVATTLAVGLGLGAAGALLLVLVLRRFWVPDYLQNPVTLMVVATAFAAANALQHESGLFATTVMGVILANQRIVSVHQIKEFKENLSVLLISSLFIVLGARLDVAQMAEVRWSHVGFVAALILVARPLGVAASTLGSGLSRRERVFLAWMAPRGVVAASVSSVFAIELRNANVPGADQLVPAIFAVIVGTVTVYGLTAAPLARYLGLAKPEARGFLVVGANPVARMIARALQEDRFEVLLADTNQENVAAAHLDGLTTFAGSANSEEVFERIQLSGIGRLLGLTPSETANALAVSRFARLFGRSETYQLPSRTEHGSRAEKVSHEQRGRPLFAPDLTYPELLRRVEAGGIVKRTKLTEQFTLAQFRAANPGAVPLYLLDPSGVLSMIVADAPVNARAGQTLVSLAPPAAQRSA